MNKKELHESLVVHRDGNLQLKIYPLGRTYCHWHEELEFIYPTSGYCQVTLNGEPITVRQGQALLVSGGDLHSPDCKETGSGHAIVLHPHICGSECAHLFSAYRLKRLFDESDPCDRSILENLKKIVSAYQERDFMYELKIRAYASDTFRIIFENNMFREHTPLQTETMEAFEKMITYLHAHFSDKLTLEDLSVCCSYSKPYIIRLFKQYAGTSPIDYLNKYRISKAQTMLSADDKNVLEIALACGFENVGYFIRTFKKHTGQTPGKWRKL